LLGSYERVEGYSVIFKTYYIHAVGDKGAVKELLKSYERVKGYSFIFKTY
jgi:hypothetical protein